METIIKPLAIPGMNLVRDLRDTELTKYDWYGIRAITTGEPVPANVMAYMQALRDMPGTATPEVDDAGNLLNATALLNKVQEVL